MLGTIQLEPHVNVALSRGGFRPGGRHRLLLRGGTVWLWVPWLIDVGQDGLYLAMQARLAWESKALEVWPEFQVSLSQLVHEELRPVAGGKGAEVPGHHPWCFSCAEDVRLR